MYCCFVCVYECVFILLSKFISVGVFAVIIAYHYCISMYFVMHSATGLFFFFFFFFPAKEA